MAPAPPTAMKILHLATSSGGDGSSFKSCMSSLDLKSASAVLIDVQRSSMCDERFLRQRESPAASVSLSPDERRRDMLPPPSGGDRLTLPAHPSVPPRRTGPAEARPRRRRARAASPPWGGEQRSDRLMDGDGEAVMSGAVRDVSATCCSTTAETATLPSAGDAHYLSRDLGDHRDMFAGQPTRRSSADVTRQCHRRSASGVAADRKFRLCRKQFDADDCFRQVAMSTTSFQQFPERYTVEF